MQTLRAICSDITNELKALNLDDRFSFRFLSNRFIDRISTFLRVDARSRELLKQYDLWKPIHCVELTVVPVTTCGFIDGCNSLKRSVIKLPEAYVTNYGSLVKVFTIVDNHEYTQIKSFEYSDYTNREFIVNKRVFWVENGYIYIPNDTAKQVKILIIPKIPIEVDILNGEASKCTSPLDSNILYPDYLVSLAKQEVVNGLANITKRIVEDEKGDDNTNRK